MLFDVLIIKQSDVATYSCRVPNVSNHNLNSKSVGFQLPRTPWVMQNQGWAILPDGMANCLRVLQFAP